jgi:tRNA nucleotidyltransferase (CCA-adding enzyme)
MHLPVLGLDNTPPLPSSCSIAEAIHAFVIELGVAMLAVPVAMESTPQAANLLQEGYQFVVFYADVKRLIEMNLGHIPVQAISVPFDPSQRFVEDIFPALTHYHAQRYSSSLQKEASITSGTSVGMDMKQQLSLLFPTRFIAALYELQSLFHRSQLKGYLIGGIARDLILTEDRTMLLRDIDITVEGEADQAARFVDSHSRNFTVLDVYEEFGTAKLQYKDLVMLDFASTRCETYQHCGALPTIQSRGVELIEDIRRRDFSINTLALAIHDVGRLFDHVNGLEDLEARRIHVLTGATFFEDPSRILRAYKFATRLGFTLSPQTSWLMQQFLQVVGETGYKGGGARIKESLKEWLSMPPGRNKHELFTHFLSIQGMRVLMTSIPGEQSGERKPFTLGVMQRQQLIHSMERLHGLWDEAQQLMLDVFRQESPDCDPLDPDTCNERVLWNIYICFILSALQQNGAVLEMFMHRLELTRGCREVYSHFSELLKVDPISTLSLDASGQQICQAFDPYDSIALVAYVLHHEQATDWIAPLAYYLKRWKNLKPELSGDDLIALGLPEGGAIGQCLKALRLGYITRQIQHRDDEVAYALEFHQQLQMKQIKPMPPKTEPPPSSWMDEGNL